MRGHAKRQVRQGPESGEITAQQRLGGLGQQGMGAANQLAGFANQTGGMLGQMRMGLGQQQAGNAINYGNAMSAADGIFGNNVMKAISMAISAATGMPVGMGSPGSNSLSASPGQTMGNNWGLGGYGK